MTDRENVLRTNPQATCIHSDGGGSRAPGYKVYDRGVTGLVWNALSMSCRTTRQRTTAIQQAARTRIRLAHLWE